MKQKAESQLALLKAEFDAKFAALQKPAAAALTAEDVARIVAAQIAALTPAAARAAGVRSRPRSSSSWICSSMKLPRKSPATSCEASQKRRSILEDAAEPISVNATVEGGGTNPSAPGEMKVKKVPIVNYQGNPVSALSTTTRDRHDRSPGGGLCQRQPSDGTGLFGHGRREDSSATGLGIVRRGPGETCGPGGRAGDRSQAWRPPQQVPRRLRRGLDPQHVAASRARVW